MHLVHRQRLRDRMRGGTTRHPGAVLPDVGRRRHDGGGLRRHLRRQRHRVGFEDPAAAPRPDLELVAGPDGEVGDEELPDAARAERAHGVALAVPAVVIAHHADRGRVGCPDRERHALLVTLRAGMGSQRLPQPLVTAFGAQMKVQVAEGRRVTVRVARDALLLAAVARREAVGERRSRMRALPHPVREEVERQAAAAVEDGLHRLGERTASPDHGDSAIRRILRGVGAEHGVRRVVPPFRHGLPVGVRGVVDAAHARSLTFRMWTGSAKASSRT